MSPETRNILINEAIQVTDKGIGVLERRIAATGWVCESQEMTIADIAAYCDVA